MSGRGMEGNGSDSDHELKQKMLPAKPEKVEQLEENLPTSNFEEDDNRRETN